MISSQTCWPLDQRGAHVCVEMPIGLFSANILVNISREILWTAIFTTCSSLLNIIDLIIHIILCKLWIFSTRFRKVLGMISEWNVYMECCLMVLAKRSTTRKIIMRNVACRCITFIIKKFWLVFNTPKKWFLLTLSGTGIWQENML